MHSVPVIDVGDLLGSDGDRRQRVADELGRACETVGFLSVVGHGIDPAVIDDAFTQMRRLFSLPTPTKLDLVAVDGGANRGYDRPDSRRLDPTQPEGPTDLNESYMLGPEFLAGKSGPMQGENIWPALDGFREPIERYHLAAMSLCERLLEAMALSLGLDERFFASAHTAPVCTLRMLHYPPRPADAAADQLGAGAHTDWGAITVLAQDDVGSLQVLARDQTWVDVEPYPGALVVNVGDLLARWTNDRYTSTLHRVVGAPDTERYSVACFFDLDHDAHIECLPTCTSEDNPPRYEPTTAGEHLMERYYASLVA